MSVKNILACKCPRCKEGNLFKQNNIFEARSLFDMYENCPKCGQDFVVEPGFYLGAMWVSYPFVLLIFLLIVGVTYFFIGNIFFAFLISAIVQFLLLPFYIRIGRSAWLHLFA